MLNKSCFILLILLLFACGTENKGDDSKTVPKEEVAQKTLFTMLNEEQTGIGFKNHNKESKDFNYYQFEYFYNGGGVALADFNNDGLQDIFFTSNMAPNKIYVNLGDLKFQDATGTANVNSGELDWCTGVTVVDINQDGWQDIYVCRSGWFKGEEKEKLRNLLFINNKDFTFTESAAEYGVDILAYSTQAAFFDYDNDNDLDLFLINHPNEFKTVGFTALGGVATYKFNHETSNLFFRNDNGKFTDLTKTYNLLDRSHSLGIKTLDFNNDGWLDLFVSNDYLIPDDLLLNKQGRGFENMNASAFKHMPKFGMGADVADINNDGFQDIFSVEMLAKDNLRKKTTMASMNPELYWLTVNNGMLYQDMHNGLQLNNGNNSFSEIAWLSGVAETDWSWCPLFADFDNDGWQDLFITNGYKRDVLDKDYHKNAASKIEDKASSFEELRDLIPSAQLANFAYRNKGDLTFQDVSASWGLNTALNGNGAAYADLDNDGDLDLVVNNMDEKAKIYRNNGNKNNALRIKLMNGDQISYGAKVTVVGNAISQTKELSNGHGYLSRSEDVLHFGMGNKTMADSVIISWNNGQFTVLQNVEFEDQIIVDFQAAKRIKLEVKSSPRLFENADGLLVGNKVHLEKEFEDYEREILLPHKLSQEGPFLGISDINNDGSDDIFVGAGAGYPGQLYLSKNGKYYAANNSFLNADRQSEDLGALFFDYDGDGDEDLYVASGSNEYEINSENYYDRLYENLGGGKFAKTENVIPQIPASGSCVEAGDFDGDGDLDLFVGGFLTPGLYPQPGYSMILRNDEGKFNQLIAEENGDMSAIGMVKDGKWIDLNKDGNLDLVIVGHWMPITVLINDGNKFVNRTEAFGMEETVGWWNCVEAFDADGDGYLDLIAGNLGLNSKNKATVNEPFKVYADDFDGNGTNDIVLGYYNDGVCYPVRGLQCSSEQVPKIKKQIPTYQEFGMSNLEKVYGTDALDKSTHFDANLLASSIFFNNSGKSFEQANLPYEAQFAPLNAFTFADTDGNGSMEVLAVGNQYPVEVETGRYDACFGVLLENAGNRTLTSVPNVSTGLFVDGDSKDLKLLNFNNEPYLLVAKNREKLQLIKMP